MDRPRKLRKLLHELEAELRHLDLWQCQPPSAAALASKEPFCVDTLTLTEWLQWLAIPRLHALLDGQLSLPRTSDIYAIAEESFRDSPTAPRKLLLLIRRLDSILNLQ